MEPGRLLKYARRRAGLSQSELAERSGFTQPAIARIETGGSSPRYDTLARLLAACGRRITTEEARGEGVDRTAIRETLKLGPAERLHRAVAAARNLERMVDGARRLERAAPTGR